MILVVAPGDAVNATDNALTELLDIAQAFLDDLVDLVQNDVQIAVHDDVTHRLGLAQALRQGFGDDPGLRQDGHNVPAILWLPKGYGSNDVVAEAQILGVTHLVKERRSSFLT